MTMLALRHCEETPQIGPQYSCQHLRQEYSPLMSCHCRLQIVAQTHRCLLRLYRSHPYSSHACPEEAFGPIRHGSIQEQIKAESPMPTTTGEQQLYGSRHVAIQATHLLKVTSFVGNSKACLSHGSSTLSSFSATGVLGTPSNRIY